MLCNVVHCNCRNWMGYCMHTACIHPEIKNIYDKFGGYSNTTDATQYTVKQELLYSNQTIITNKEKY